MEDNEFVLTDKIKNHLDNLTKASGLPYNEESVRLMTDIWLKKKNMFESQIKSLEMLEVNSFNKDDRRGALLLTYSGSLITISTMTDNTRKIEYFSIKLRKDVPEIIIINDANSQENIEIDKGVIFTKGPIKTTSHIFKIAVCAEDVSIEEQEKRIRQATIFLTNGFIKINRTLSISGEDVPEQFNLKSMIKFIANKNDITQKEVKQILEDFIMMIETGMLLKEKVSFGRIGSMFLKMKPPQKARVGINPSTQEKITINAKPAMYVPKINFSKSLKEKALAVEVEDTNKTEN
jgi:nucleoid DNA-binding protein